MSALQKAIRRGEFPTAWCASCQLLESDKASVWRRLQTIALEDIGVGDAETAAEIIAITTIPEARKLLGGNTRALRIAGSLASGALKDRSGDHLWSILRHDCLSEARFSSDRGLSRDGLAAALTNAKLTWAERMWALAQAMGANAGSPARVRPRDAKIAEVFLTFRELCVPGPLIDACEVSAPRMRDALPFLVPFAWLLWRESGAKGAERHHALPKQDLIGAFPAWAFDPLHTRMGRAAVELWWQDAQPRPPWRPKQLAIALWNLESAACDRTLDWPLGDELRARAYHADLLARGVPEEEHEELMEYVASGLPALHRARIAVWEALKPDSKPELPQVVLLRLKPKPFKL